MSSSVKHISADPQQPATQELALPLLCLVASHRPLAFVVGQCYYLLEPLLAILGLNVWRTRLRTWAEPKYGDQLEAALAASSRYPDPAITVQPLQHLQQRDSLCASTSKDSIHGGL